MPDELGYRRPRRSRYDADELRRLNRAELNGAKLNGAELVLVRRPGAKVRGEPLPFPSSEAEPVEDPDEGILLDMAKVARLREESEDLARELAVIFDPDFDREEEEADALAPSPGERNAPLSEPVREASSVTSPEARFASVLSALRERREWSKEEFSALARRFGAMPNALLEEINAWAEDELGDLILLSEGDLLILNEDVWNENDE